MSTDNDAEKERVRRNHPLEKYVASRGVELKRNGQELVAKCPLHEDGSPSFSVNVTKQLWRCHGCNKGGDLFQFVMDLDGLTFKDAFTKLGGGEHRNAPSAPPRPAPPREVSAPVAVAKVALGPIVATYDYTDEAGAMLYQVCRYEPEGQKKTFRQRRPDGKGGWVWNLGDVPHTIYCRSELASAPGELVWLVEGEKDANTVRGFGMYATTNSGGAGEGKWTDAMSALLRGREVILCGDNDKEGQGDKHMDAIERSLAPFAKSTRRIRVPGTVKDLTDYVQSFANPSEGMMRLIKLAEDAVEVFDGVPLPIRSMTEVAGSYQDFIKQSDARCVRLGNWIPFFHALRPLVPGEMVTILAGTGVGKTAILQNIALAISPLFTLFFELELPETLTFERFVAIATRKSGGTVWQKFFKGEDAELEWRKNGPLSRVFMCDKSGLSVETMRKYVNHAHLKMMHRPACVMIDYFSLIGSNGGSRYERMSAAAEEIKVMAKETNTVVICTSQVARKEKKDTSPEVFLHDAKDSGSIENSSGLVLGAWKEPGDEKTMHIKILKSTKGGAGKSVKCHVDESLHISQVEETTPPPQ